MNITLLAYGSRGDVQPFLALAVGLQKAGHAVTLAAPHRFTAFISAQHITPAPLPGDPEEISRRFNDAGTNPLKMIHAIKGYVLEIAPEIARTAVAACAQAEMVLHGFLFTTGGHNIACQRGIPDISVQTFPMFAPTRAFPNVSVPQIPPGWMSFASHWLFDRVFRYGGNSGYASIRHAHPDIPLPEKLCWPFAPSAPRLRTPVLIACSPTVIPAPVEWQRQPSIHVPGYFFLEEPVHEPDQVLVDFLVAGEPPVCITFGSMVHRQMERIETVMLEALRRSGRRAIVLTGWGEWGRKEAPGVEILHLDSADHTWLFPRCSLVIHHGGAGTTGAALRAGVPSMVIPLAGDQPFWAQRVNALQVGPHSLAPGKLTVSAMMEAFGATELAHWQGRAREVGRKISAEDGVGTAVRLVEQYAAERIVRKTQEQP